MMALLIPVLRLQIHLSRPEATQESCCGTMRVSIPRLANGRTWTPGAVYPKLCRKQSLFTICLYPLHRASKRRERAVEEVDAGDLTSNRGWMCVLDFWSFPWLSPCLE